MTPQTHPASATAPQPDPAQPRRSLARRLWREWVIPLTITAIVMTGVRASIADWNDVPTGSMKPTILEGDRIYVNKLAFGLRVPLTHLWLARWGSPARGDIVTFASPADGTRLVKRVVGLPGDRVELRRNRLFINGRGADLELITDAARDVLPAGPAVNVTLQRERLGGEAGGLDHLIATVPGLASMSDFPETVVPEGCCFVMGDNRDLSSDSRFIGPVPIASMYGRSSAVALSVDVRAGWSPRWERWLMTLK